MERNDKKQSSNYVYILMCSDLTLYTGWTNNLENRIIAHNTQKGAKYTKNRLPAQLVYYEEYEDKKEAMKREFAIKRLTRLKKEEIIKELNDKVKVKNIKNINKKINNL